MTATVTGMPIIGIQARPGFKCGPCSGNSQINLNIYSLLKKKLFERATFVGIEFQDLDQVDTSHPDFSNLGVREDKDSTKEDRVEHLKVSYENKGWLTDYWPPCIDTDGEWIGGRGRVRAAKEMGEKWIPVARYSRENKSLRSRTNDSLCENIDHDPSSPATYNDVVAAGFRLVQAEELKREDIDPWLYREIKVQRRFNNSRGGTITKLKKAILKRVEKEESLVFVPEEKNYWDKWIQGNLGLKEGEYVLVNTKDTTRSQRLFMNKIMPAVCLGKDPVNIIFYSTEYNPKDVRANLTDRIKEIEGFYKNVYKFVNVEISGLISIDTPASRPWNILGAIPQIDKSHDLESSELVSIERY
jgi:hypothetical protein